MFRAPLEIWAVIGPFIIAALLARNTGPLFWAVCAGYPLGSAALCAAYGLVTRGGSAEERTAQTFLLSIALQSLLGAWLLGLLFFGLWEGASAVLALFR